MKYCSILFLSLVLAYGVMAQQPGNIKPGDQLILKNIPAIPVATGEAVRKYTESRSAGHVDWVPGKREMLVSTRFGNTPQLHYLSMPMGARKQITFFDEPVSGATFEPVSGNYFIFSRDAGGNEFGQLYRYDMKSGNITLLTDGGRSQNGNIRWNNSRTKISFTSTKRNGTDRDVYVMNPLDPATTSMVCEVKGGGWAVTDWAPDDRKLILQESLSVNEANLYVYDMETKTRKPVGPVSKKEQVVNSGGRFSKDGKYIFFITDADNEYRRLARMNADGTDLKIITPGLKWDIGSTDMNEEGTKILFTVSEAGITRVYLLDVATLKYEELPGMPTGLIGGISWRPGSNEFAFSYNSARVNADVYSYNCDNGKTERWTESELGGIVSNQLSEAELIKWKGHDELEISGFYFKPNKKFEGKRPVIIMIHGGPEGQSLPVFQSRNNYFMEELGVAIIYPNVRGSTGYGKTFVKLDNGYMREHSVKDIGALIDWIATRPDLDASRIMVMGGSYGGYMSLAVSVHYADKIRCAVDVVGISNFNTFLKNTESYRRDLRRVEYGDERDPKMMAFLEDISPLTNAARIKKPLLIVQGGNDPRVPRTEAEQMYNTLVSQGNTVWYLEASDEGHGFRKKNNVDFQFYVTIEFMKKFLIP